MRSAKNQLEQWLVGWDADLWRIINIYETSGQARTTESTSYSIGNTGEWPGNLLGSLAKLVFNASTCGTYKY